MYILEKLCICGFISLFINLKEIMTSDSAIFKFGGVGNNFK